MRDEAIIMLGMCALLCASCARKQPDPYEEAGYVRFGGGKPHILPSQPSYPYYPRYYPQSRVITVPTK